MKPGRNDPCVCGSGENFKKCCGSGHSQEDRRWVEDNIINNGDMLLYGTLQNAMEDIPAAEIWQEFRRIGELYLGGGKDRTRLVHELVDNTIETLVKRDKRFGYPPPFCHKGCCNCCHELVYCTAEEAESIQDYCREHDLEIDHEKLQRQLDHVEFDQSLDHTGVTTWNNQKREDQSCVFLHQLDKCCSIWPVRPLVCRVHLAEGTDQYCAPHNGVENPHSRGINYIELSYILSVVFTFHKDSIKKTMGRLLLATQPGER
jgi:Fe-S-cluster containining protein